MIGANSARRTAGSVAWARACKITKALDDPAILNDAPDDAIRIFRLVGENITIEQVIAALGGYRHAKLYVEWKFEDAKVISDAYAASLRHAVDVAHANGVLICGPVFASGAFDKAIWAWFRANDWFGFDAIALQAYWSHQYGFTAYNALRYRDYWDPQLDKPLLIVEAGEDKVQDGPNNTIVGNPGFQANNVGGDVFRTELVRFNAETAKDQVPVAFYGVGLNPPWQPFDGETLAPITDGIFNWPATGGISVQPVVQQAVKGIGRVDGFDISNNNGTIDWTLAGDSGHKFAFIKRCEGLSFVDSYFDTNWQAASDYGLVRGAYTYAKPTNGSGADHAKRLIDLVKDWRPGDIPILDLEDPGVPTGAGLTAFTVDFHETCRSLVKTPGLLYTGTYYLQAHGMIGAAQLANYGLWLALYQSEEPAIPAPWQILAVWQYTSNGIVPGVAGPCDLDIFNGTADQLRKYGVPA